METGEHHEAPGRLKELGWSQGAVLSDGHAAELVLTLEPGERVLVVSQDCDVVHRSLLDEPNVELIAFSRIDAPDGSLQHGKNPRRLHLEVATGWVVFDVHRRFQVDRAGLAIAGPAADVALSRSQTHLVANWIAKRYTRPAFPDEFNERVRPVDRRIESLLKKKGAPLTGIYLALESLHECVAGEDYRLDLRVTAEQESVEDRDLEDRLAGAVLALASLLNDCDGVVVLDSELVSEDDFSLGDLRRFARWDRDYRTHSGKPGGPLAPWP